MFFTIKLYLHLNCILMLNWIVWNITIFMEMDLALNNLQRLICHKTQTTNQILVRLRLLLRRNGIDSSNIKCLKNLFWNMQIVLKECWYSNWKKWWPYWVNLLFCVYLIFPDFCTRLTGLMRIQDPRHFFTYHPPAQTSLAFSWIYRLSPTATLEFTLNTAAVCFFLSA